MSKDSNKLGSPNLESSDDTHGLTHISSTPESVRNFPKLTADRSTSLPETMKMFAILIDSFEAQYQINTRLFLLNTK